MKVQRYSPQAGRCAGLRRVVATAFGLTLLASFGLSAEADDNRKSKEPTRSVYLVRYEVGGEVRYTKRPIKTVTVTESHYRSFNAYVCTPSGFGRKARCYVAGP